MWQLLICFGLLLASSQAAEAHKMYAFETPVGGKVGAVFGDVKGGNGSPLVSIKTDFCKSAQLHQMSVDGGIMKMRRVEEVPAGKDGKIHLEPTGYHVMLMGIKEPLKKGTDIPLILGFKNGEKWKVSVPVLSRADVGADGPEERPQEEIMPAHHAVLETPKEASKETHKKESSKQK